MSLRYDIQTETGRNVVSFAKISYQFEVIRHGCIGPQVAKQGGVGQDFGTYFATAFKKKFGQSPSRLLATDVQEVL